MRNAEYAENGYIVRRGLVPPDLIAALNDRFAQLAEGDIEPALNMQVVRNVQVAKGLVKPIAWMRPAIVASPRGVKR